MQRLPVCLVFLVFALSRVRANQDQAFFGIEPKLLALQWELTEFAEKYGLDLAVPRLAIIGTQSVGKTSVLQRFAGFPLGFTSHGTGTRCVVLYLFRRDPALIEPQVIVDGVSIQPKELPSWMQDKMEEIGRTAGFTETTITVIIRSAQTANIDVADVPGFRGTTADPKNADLIKRIAAHVVRDPAFRIIMVCRVPDEAASMTEIDIIDSIMIEPQWSSHPPRRSWKKDTNVIVNYVNDRMETGLDSIQKARTLFTTFLAEGYDSVHFVALQPKRPVPTSTDGVLTYEEQQRLLEAAPDNEAALFAQWKAALIERATNLTSLPQAERTWDPSWDSLLTTRNATEHIARVWQESVKAKLPGLQVKLQEYVAEQQAVLDTAKASGVQSTHELRRRAGKYASDWSKQLTAALSTERVEVIPSTTMRRSVHTSFKAEQFGLTYEEELENVSAVAGFAPGPICTYAGGSQPEPRVPSYVSPCNPLWLSTLALGRHDDTWLQLDAKLTGDRALHRFLDVFRVTAYHLVNATLSPTEIQNLLAPDAGRDPNADHVITRGVLYRLEVLRDLLNYAVVHIKFLYERYAEGAHANVQHIPEHHGAAAWELKAFVNRVFGEQLQTQLHHILRSCEEWLTELRVAPLTDVGVLPVMCVLTPRVRTAPDGATDPEQPGNDAIAILSAAAATTAATTTAPVKGGKPPPSPPPPQALELPPPPTGSLTQAPKDIQRRKLSEDELRAKRDLALLDDVLRHMQHRFVLQYLFHSFQDSSPRVEWDYIPDGLLNAEINRRVLPLCGEFERLFRRKVTHHYMHWVQQNLDITVNNKLWDMEDAAFVATVHPQLGELKVKMERAESAVTSGRAVERRVREQIRRFAL